MAEPPRLSAIRLPWENSIIYFVTICVKDRRKVLATPAVFEAIINELTHRGSCQLPLGVESVEA